MTRSCRGAQQCARSPAESCGRAAARPYTMAGLALVIRSVSEGSGGEGGARREPVAVSAQASPRPAPQIPRCARDDTSSRTLLIVFLLAFFALSCANRNDTRERIELWGLGREGEVVADMVPEFERQNPGIKVVVQQIPWTAAHEKLLTAYVGESVPDVAQMGNTWIPEMVAIGALENLTPLVGKSLGIDQRDYFAGIWATNVVNGSLYGIPWYVDTRVVFYRTDVLASVGYKTPPRTWDEWMDAMARIVQQRKARYAILLPTNEWPPIVQLALTNGSTLLDAQGTHGAFEQPPFAEAFHLYLEMFRRRFAPVVSNTQVANLYDQFAQGDFAMYISGPWDVGEFRRRLPPAMNGKWLTMPLPARDAQHGPTGVSMAGGSSLVLFNASRHKVAAMKLIEYLSQPKQQIRFHELTGDLPARRSAWHSPALANDPYFPAFREQLERVAPLPQVPEWEEIATTIYEHGEAAVRGKFTEAAALADLDRTTDRILEKRRWVLAHRR
jgi:multiple sugar transport system substrate-binding protein